MKLPDYLSKLYRNTHLWIVVTCIGVWILVFQNIVTKDTKNVYVVGGKIESEVSGNVRVPNMVDVNIQGINGHSDCFYGYGRNGANDFFMIPVTVK